MLKVTERQGDCVFCATTKSQRCVFLRFAPLLEEKTPKVKVDQKAYENKKHLMVRCYIQTLIISQAVSPSVLVLRPYSDEPVQDTCRVLPIWIGLTEATQMGLAIENIRLPRPVTHDVFLDALTNLNTYVDHVLIAGVKNETFFVRLYLRHHGDLIDLDARPSDAINLAVRQNAPIYIEEDVLEKESYPFIIKKNHILNENDIEQFHTFIKTIEPEDFEEDKE